MKNKIKEEIFREVIEELYPTGFNQARSIRKAIDLTLKKVENHMYCAEIKEHLQGEDGKCCTK